MRQIYCLLLTAVTFLGVTVTVTAVNFLVNAEGYGHNQPYWKQKDGTGAIWYSMNSESTDDKTWNIGDFDDLGTPKCSIHTTGDFKNEPYECTNWKYYMPSCIGGKWKKADVEITRSGKYVNV